MNTKSDRHKQPPRFRHADGTRLELGELPMRIFGDFAVNLEGDARAKGALHPNKGDQRYAYQIGAGIGQLKVKKDWQLRGFLATQRAILARSKLVDSDIFDGPRQYGRRGRARRLHVERRGQRQSDLQLWLAQ